jgi:phosphomannomutase
MYRFIFDVDGTLTPSRQRIDSSFSTFFLEFCQSYPVYLITGSDRPKTIEQLGLDIVNASKRVYNCSGNDVWEHDNNIYTSPWKISLEAKEWLARELDLSNFAIRAGRHLEERPGCVNFSVVGRLASLSQRQIYIDYDEKNKERERIALQFNHKFPTLSARVGGDTGIDIFPKGHDKSQIIKDFSVKDRLFFFGDKMEPGGNDYPLKAAIETESRGECFTVKGWENTYKILSVMKASI